ncbi:MAG: S8 family serine peptidase [Acidimicrobiia bacterium]
MKSQRGLSWDHKIGKGTAIVAIIALTATLLATGGTVSQHDSTGPIDVIVREVAPLTDAAESLVERVGGTVEDNLGLIGGFSATIPADALGLLNNSPDIEAATPDGTIQFATAGWDDATVLGDIDFRSYSGSLYQITRTTKAVNAWGKGYTGSGVDVALIDTGVAPLPALPRSRLVDGPDLSFESQNPDLEHLDTNGHGTHMAGIIAGLDIDLDLTSPGDSTSFIGMAPGARVINVKVGAHDGSVDVSQVIAAIDWVVQHRNDDGFNIRVINLAFGTDATQSYVLDPLAYAVEQAWQNDIVVVVSAGNDGNGSRLRNPAIDPFVIAVGSGFASDFRADNNTRVVYDSLSEFSNCGTPERSVDLLAPGKSITSLRTPGSYADVNNPKARIGEDFFLGSGTSQATAVVSGAAALVLDAWPDLSADEVKYLLTTNATPIVGASATCQGADMIDLDFLASNAKKAPTTKDAEQTFEASVGTGALEGARGSHHVEMNGVVLQGEQDIMGSPWIGFNTTTTECKKEGKGKNAVMVCTDVLEPVETLWDGGTWNGRSWSGTSWSGDAWSGLSWSGTSWSGLSWSGLSWSGLSWSDQSWSGLSWSGLSWSGTSWSGTSWSGLSWSSGGTVGPDQGVRWS